MSPLQRLLDIMARLRHPEKGCPWDLEQTFESLTPYTIEESYEVADAIQKGDMAGLKEELGDVLFQVIFYAQLAREKGLFNFDDITTAIADKMERRHPNIFGNAATVKTAREQEQKWEAHKAVERQHKTPDSILDDIPANLPPLTRAAKLQKKASTVNFDWNRIDSVFDKLQEEIAELKAEIPGGDAQKIAHELGDILFVVTHLANKLKASPETALMSANQRFYDRFTYIERALKSQGRKITETPLEDMEKLWQEAKSHRKK